MAAGDDDLTYQTEAGEDKIDFLQNSDLVLDTNSIAAYSLEKDEPSFGGQMTYSPTPFPNTPITSNNSTDWKPRPLPPYFTFPGYQGQSTVYQGHGFQSSGNFIHLN